MARNTMRRSSTWGSSKCPHETAVGVGARTGKCRRWRLTANQFEWTVAVLAEPRTCVSSARSCALTAGRAAAVCARNKLPSPRSVVGGDPQYLLQLLQSQPRHRSSSGASVSRSVVCTSATGSSRVTPKFPPSYRSRVYSRVASARLAACIHILSWKGQAGCIVGRGDN